VREGVGGREGERKRARASLRDRAGESDSEIEGERIEGSWRE
jgi:hypothetical protein